METFARRVNRLVLLCGMTVTIDATEILSSPCECQAADRIAVMVDSDARQQDAALKHMVGPSAGNLYYVALWLDIADEHAGNVVSVEYDLGPTAGDAPRIMYPQISPENRFLYVPLSDHSFTPTGTIGFRDGQTLEIRGTAIPLTESRPVTGWEHYVFAYMLNIAQRNRDALRMVDRALDTDSTLTSALVLRGRIFGDVGRFQEARQAFDAALARDPLNPLTLNEYAWFLVEGLPNATPTDLNDAQLYSQRAVNRRPSPEHYDTLGWVFYKRGSFTSALETLREAELFRASVGESSNTWLAIQNHLGHVLLALKRTGEARRAFEAVVRIGDRYRVQDHPLVIDARYQLREIR
jgi:tetratricopeptide (TPR) repeat protein